ncbi:MAG: hypothetical protein QXW38_09535 [Candidatus Nitrosotenuis sp.]
MESEFIKNLIQMMGGFPSGLQYRLLPNPPNFTDATTNIICRPNPKRLALYVFCNVDTGFAPVASRAATLQVVTGGVGRYIHMLHFVAKGTLNDVPISINTPFNKSVFDVGTLIQEQFQIITGGTGPAHITAYELVLPSQHIGK